MTDVSPFFLFGRIWYLQRGDKRVSLAPHSLNLRGVWRLDRYSPAFVFVIFSRRICYNAAINACAQSGEWETALSLADEMRRSVPVLGTGAGPDVFTFNSIMHGMASAGECERLLVLLGEMREEYGVSPDVVSYNTAMAACNEVSSRRVS